MKRYLVFIGTFLLSFIGAGIFLIGIMKLIDDASPGFINTPPSIVGMFILFLAIPSLIAYYVAFEFKKSEKMAGLELDSGHDAKVEKPHWLFALIATFAIGGAIIGLLAIFPPIQWSQYSFIGVDESEFQKIPTPPFVFNNNLSSESGVEASKSANWKTYTNNLYGYSIKYPSTVIQETKITKDFPTQIYNTTHDYFKIDGGTLEIYGVCGREIQSIKNVDTNIGGQKTMKLYESDTNGIITAISRPNSNESICFSFNLSDDPAKTQLIDVLFDQILSTFKFTN